MTCLTGLGLVTGFGAGVATYWNGLLAGTALRVTQQDGPLPVKGIRYDGPGTGKAGMIDLALREALGKAALPAVPGGALLVQVGQGPRVATVSSDADLAEMVGPFPWGHPLVPATVERVFLSHACASVLVAMGFARDWLRSGLVEVAVVVGAFSLNGYEWLGMAVSRALGEGVARPFDRRRDGIALGEGAGAVIMETAEHVARRGHIPEIQLAGLSTRIAGGHASSSGSDVVANCVRRVVVEAGITHTPYVHAHATGTIQGDAAEIAGLERAAEDSGWNDVPVSSHKGAVGHLMHASAFPSIAAAVSALRHRLAPGTPGLREPAPTRRLRLLRDVVKLEPTTTAAIVTNFGFAGNSAAMVLVREPRGVARERLHPPSDRGDPDP